jgi:hypothetical protein
MLVEKKLFIGRNPDTHRRWCDRDEARGSVDRIRFPPKADSKKQGKLGPDAGAPREALYLCMRERGKPVDGPRSPPPFLN